MHKPPVVGEERSSRNGTNGLFAFAFVFNNLLNFTYYFVESPLE